MGRAGYICRMRKKLLVLMAGAASIAGPVQAQFNTVSTVPSRYRVEVVSAGRDNAATLPGNTLSVQDTLPSAGDAAPALPADTCKHVWIERYLSVSYPLRRMKINSLYGYRKDAFTGKKKFHNGIDLHNQAEVLAYKVDEALSKCKKELDKEEKNRIKADVANLRRCLRKDKPEKMNETEEANLRQAKSQLEASANHLMVLYASEQSGNGSDGTI